tara:strand:+ start:445 stop:1383 length:939 start_codon:yes stop_codon:yes gene_type:complete
MKYKILVTGGAGYLGSIVVPDLLECGHHVTVLDNFMFKQTSLNHCCYHPNFKIIKGDIRIQSTIEPLINNSDVIIPLAALVGAPICDLDPNGASSINREAINLMLKLVSKDQIILMPTTNSAYGTGEQNNYCTEESPLKPISKYAIDKVNIEKKLMNHQSSISFRLATVFGMSPRMRTDLLVNDFTYRAVHDGFVILFESGFKRNYIHVRDVSRVFLHALENFEKMKGQIFNVGLSDANVSKKELCESIQNHLKNFVFMEAPIRKDPDQRNYIVSNEKIEATGFFPKYSLDKGIIELIKGFQMLKNSMYGNV